MTEQTENRRPDGQFATGNNAGKQWQPGQTGNKNGRRGALRDIFNKLLDAAADSDGKTRREALAQCLYDTAMSGNVQAIRELMDRAEGRITERLEVTQNQGFTDDQIQEAAKTLIEHERG